MQPFVPIWVSQTEQLYVFVSAKLNTCILGVEQTEHWHFYVDQTKQWATYSVGQTEHNYFLSV